MRQVYRGTPVSPERFLNSKYYLNKRGQAYPEVAKFFCELYTGGYNRTIATGGTGSGKSTGIGYHSVSLLYKLSLMRGGPHKHFNLDPASEILFVIQGPTGAIAKDQYDRFRALVEGSPYFREQFPFDKNQKSKLVFPHRIEVRHVSGETSGLIGKNIFCVHLNEANFMEVVESSKKNIDGGVYDQARVLYDYAADRRQNRFTVAGKTHGMVYVDSSQRYPGQLTDILEREVKEELDRTGSTETYIYKKRAWDVKPPGTYKKWFYVFKGDDTRKPKVLTKDEVSAYSEEDQKLYIDKGPTTVLSSFLRDPYPVLRDAFGYATLAAHPYIPNTELLARCFNADQQSIFSHETVCLNTGQLKIIPEAIKNRKEPHWLHLDLSKTGDATGITLGHVDKFMEVEREGSLRPEIYPHVVIDGSLALTPPPGGEIEYPLIRSQIIYVLQEVYGVNIKWCTADSYESTDMLTTLRTERGIITGIKSMDRTPCIPYAIAKAALMDGRVSSPYHKILFGELRCLEYNPKTGKIDHTNISTKDVADSAGAVIYNLTVSGHIWQKHGVDMRRASASIRGQQK